jgi:hypothetical protein
MIELTARDVRGIIQRGGTLPGSARCAAFRTEAGCKQGIEIRSTAVFRSICGLKDKEKLLGPDLSQDRRGFG